MGEQLRLALAICNFAGQKRQYNAFLQGNLIDPGLFDQLMLLKFKKKVTIFSRGKLLTPPKKFEVTSPNCTHPFIGANETCYANYTSISK